MPRPMRVELISTGPGEFMVRLPEEYTGTVQLNCNTGTVVNFQASDIRRPVKTDAVDLREG